MKIQKVFEKATIQDFARAIRMEWIETNGLGGWASSTIVGAHTRRYHGLLVGATHPPVGRMVLLSKLDETICVNGLRFELGCNQYPGTVHPRGFEHLQRFERDLFPVFEYGAGGVELRKTIAGVNGENTSLVLYEVRQAPGEFLLELRPFVAGRDYHHLMRANEGIRREATFEGEVFRAQPYEGVPEIFVGIPGGSFEASGGWYYNFECAVELYRGLDFREDLFTFGVFRVRLNAGDRVGIIISTENPAGRDAFDLFAREEDRRKAVLAKAGTKDELFRTLSLAADQFVVQRGRDSRTIIAGYPWFTDWGRDTMIALPGITLITGRHEDAKRILWAFAEASSQGMLPNRFPDAGETPDYNTVDATLWFFVAVYSYLHYGGDEVFARDELMPVLAHIISWHEHGTRYSIHVDEDGLLYAGEPGVQLTWMDAKVGDWVVTPRQGKAVEINALWYNALMIYAELSRRFGNRTVYENLGRRAERIRRRFLEVFWNEKLGYLYDFVDGGHRDSSLRPNQIFALSLPFPVLAQGQARSVLRVIEDRLYTPFGLRSLSPDDPSYRPYYGGDQVSRDGAYHQGTAWGWLLGPYITALVRFCGPAGKEKARRVIEGLIPHLGDAGIGTFSEIFEGDAPHSPQGAVAQAWSVGEVLRAYAEDVLAGGR